MLLCLLHCQLHGPELRQAQAAGQVLGGAKRSDGQVAVSARRPLRKLPAAPYSSQLRLPAAEPL